MLHIALANLRSDRAPLPEALYVAALLRGRCLLAAFRCYARLDHDNYTVGSFGDSPEMATELADLAMAGIKRATASLVHDYDDGREPIPRPGDFVMMLDGERRPRFIWRTSERRVRSPCSKSGEPLPLQGPCGPRLHRCSVGHLP